jgi:hypothetical protein
MNRKYDASLCNTLLEISGLRGSGSNLTQLELCVRLRSSRGAHGEHSYIVSYIQVTCVMVMVEGLVYCTLSRKKNRKVGGKGNQQCIELMAWWISPECSKDLGLMSHAKGTGCLRVLYEQYSSMIIMT